MVTVILLETRQYGSISWRVRNEKLQCAYLSCSSVFPHRTDEESLKSFPRHLMFERFTEDFQPIPVLVEIGHR
jgi:hypothetical protein